MNSNKLLISITLLFFLQSCNQRQNITALFNRVAINYNNRTVQIPEGFTYKVLFSEGDTVVANSGIHAPAKGSQDMVVYIPIDNSNEHGYLYVNHEEHAPNKLLAMAVVEQCLK